MKTLHLTLKKKWFDMIVCNDKKHEYREIKPYWTKRLQGYIGGDFFDYDSVFFRNGYSKDSPKALVEIEGISIGMGKPEWGAPTDREVYIIGLGNVCVVGCNT